MSAAAHQSTGADLPRIDDIWEPVSHSKTRATEVIVTRMEVPGGWIYMTEHVYLGSPGFQRIDRLACFVPRPAEQSTAG